MTKKILEAKVNILQIPGIANLDKTIYNKLLSIYREIFLSIPNFNNSYRQN